jgi:hypothetical protein
MHRCTGSNCADARRETIWQLHLSENASPKTAHASFVQITSTGSWIQTNLLTRHREGARLMSYRPFQPPARHALAGADNGAMPPLFKQVLHHLRRLPGCSRSSMRRAACRAQWRRTVLAPWSLLAGALCAFPPADSEQRCRMGDDRGANGGEGRSFLAGLSESHVLLKQRVCQHRMDIDWTFTLFLCVWHQPLCLTGHILHVRTCRCPKHALVNVDLSRQIVSF